MLGDVIGRIPPWTCFRLGGLKGTAAAPMTEKLKIHQLLNEQINYGRELHKKDNEWWKKDEQSSSTILSFVAVLRP